MATTVPSMRARLGDVDYFVISMKAQELVDKVKIPKEMEGWKNLSIEERYQRDINYTRVRNQIAPYLASDSSRFFGAVVLAAINFGDAVLFEPLSDVTTKGLPGLYRTAATDMGFLTFTGGEILVPLDGQHRLKAIEFAVTGRDELGRDIPLITPCAELAQDDVAVILVPYEARKARKIFTRVNRYAKPTTTGQNIVTDDDDIIAVLSRETANNLIGARLVRFRSNTLRQNDREFTTLAILYNCNESIVTATFPEGKIDKTHLPDAAKQELYRAKVREVWEVLLDRIEVFADALSDPSEAGDDKRREIRRTNLLGKPVVQECLVRAFMRLTGPPTNMSADNACAALNGLSWDISESGIKLWENVLWTGGVDGKIITKNRLLATAIIAYCAGEQISNDAKSTLLDDYKNQFPEQDRADKTLPDLRRSSR